MQQRWQVLSHALASTCRAKIFPHVFLEQVQRAQCTTLRHNLQNCLLIFSFRNAKLAHVHLEFRHRESVFRIDTFCVKGFSVRLARVRASSHVASRKTRAKMSRDCWKII